MFRKYEKTYHLYPITSKFNLDDTSIKRLLAGEVIVEEKMDGANVAIIGHPNGFRLQKRGSLVGPSEHPQFHALNNWAWSRCDQLNALPKHTWVYGEWLYAVHTIYYDSLPDYFLVFDVYSDGVWLNRTDRTDFCEKYGFHQIPLITSGSFQKNDLRELIPSTSMYGSDIEGIVVKRYAKNGYFRSKIVRPEFIKTFEDSDNWSKQYPIKRNKLYVETEEIS